VIRESSEFKRLLREVNATAVPASATSTLPGALAQ